MSRQDKVGAIVLGSLLFAGLFYFIYTTMKNPLPADFGDETLAEDTFANEEDMTAEEETPIMSTTTAPAPAENPPAEAPAGQK